MGENSIYADIARRCGGDIYIGVVGPVRTGKSTFIHRFLETVVLPNIENEYDRERTQDQIPQSASGKTVMTTEPKFVPDEAVCVRVDGDVELRVKMVDCVGYMVDGALGANEDGRMRMVMTPWSDKEMPFERAAELGTEKVIGEHATIAMLVTTDGSIADIPRESYVAAEERVVRELRESGKPFAIILNSRDPESEDAHRLAGELEEKYGAPVALVACPRLDGDDIREILSLVLGEFPVRELHFKLPDWTMALPEEHRIRREAVRRIGELADAVERIGDIEARLGDFPEFVRETVGAGDGTAEFSMPIDKSEYYAALCELTGLEITDERSLFNTACTLASAKRRYEKFESALVDAEEKGYGIVLPTMDELKLEEPELIKQAGGFGVKITAHADSVHIIKTDIKAELCPVVGSEEQSREVIRFIGEEFAANPRGVWEYNMFGRSLYDMVSDGMAAKLENMPDEAREKLGDTVGKIINDGASGLICILL